jgi:hypothetical protein
MKADEPLSTAWGGTEPTTTYFTRRARQERAQAAETASPEARKAHLELAFRYVRVATESRLCDPLFADLSLVREASHRRSAAVGGNLGQAMGHAFSLPQSGVFADLLDAIDRAER